GSLFLRLTDPTATVSVAVFDDDVEEGTENFVFNLVDGEAYEVDPNASSIDVTIEDGAPVLPVVSFTTTTPVVTEDEQPLGNFVISIDGDIPPEGLNLTVSGDVAQLLAPGFLDDNVGLTFDPPGGIVPVAFTDTGDVVFNVTVPEATATVTLFNDIIEEEPVTLNFELLPGEGFTIDQGSFSVTFEDGDSVIPGSGPTVSLSVSDTNLVEGDSFTVNFTVDETTGPIPQGGLPVFVDGPPAALSEFVIFDEDGNPAVVTEGVAGFPVPDNDAGGFFVTLTELQASLTLSVFDDGPGEGTENLTFTLVNGEQYEVDPDAGSVDITIDESVEEGLLEIGLFDADSDSLIASLTEGTEIQASVLEGRDITIAAFIPDDSPLFGTVGSIFLNLNNNQVTKTENVEPYTLFGDSNGDFQGTDLDLLESNTVTFEVYSGRRQQGDLLETVAINFNVVDDLGGNNPPIALDDSFTTNAGEVLAGDVAANDSDPDDDALTFTVLDAPDNGTLVFETDGSFQYTPDEGFTGTESFTYEVTDGEFADTAAVDILVEPSTVSVGLYDADSDQLIQLLQDGDTIDASTLPTQNLTIAAFVLDDSPLADEVESIRLNLNDGQIMALENVEPFALFGDRQGDFNGGSIPLGNNTITLDLFDRNNANGQLIETVAVDFTIV
ncbi:MAG: Ig-like domain-containing protein, partial [Cyanobacteria bacterium P01_C01_bin.147]